jgi:hypothetical protein
MKAASMSAFDPKRTLNDQLQKWWFELVPPYGSGVLHLLTAAFGTKRQVVIAVVMGEEPTSNQSG